MSIDTGVIYREDNLTALQRMSDGTVDLVYLDPPFFSSRIYEVIWGDEAEVRSFRDRWEGGIHVYIEWMRKRLMHVHRVLKPTGAMYLHCDPHASHYLKVLLDELFGVGNFKSEIVWKRTGAHGASKRYAPVHDTIFYYTKSSTRTWNPIHHDYRPEYVAEKYKLEDARGRYQLITLMPSGTRGGETGQTWRGIDPNQKGLHWRYPPARLDELEAEGMIVWSSKGQRLPRLKRYLDLNGGIPIQDVWTDIAPLNSQARERLGYPTQKPEALLERLILASTNRGDIVLDPFCGCGTAISVAQKNLRRWIGMDISPTAVNIMKQRMRRVTATPVTILGIPETEAELRVLQPFEFQNWVVQRFYGTHSPRKSGDMGIDGYSFMENNPIQVKRSDRVGRNVVDNFETAMRRGGHDVGYVVAFSFSRGAREEVARARVHDGLDIRLLTVAQMLDEARLPDRIPELASVTELPMPPARSQDSLPTAEELIDSESESVHTHRKQKVSTQSRSRRSRSA